VLDQNLGAKMYSPMPTFCFFFPFLQYMSNVSDVHIGCILCRGFPMEMLGSVVGSIISSMAEYCDYHKDADEHVKNLKRKWEVLESRKEDIESRLEAELRRGKKQKKEVELWLGEVHKIKDEINIEQVPARWKFLSRMRMGECASKKTKVVEDL
jgi:chaperonin cofactor prefoldin